VGKCHSYSCLFLLPLSLSYIFFCVGEVGHYMMASGAVAVAPKWRREWAGGGFDGGATPEGQTGSVRAH